MSEVKSQMSIQCDQFGRFLKVLSNIFFTKEIQVFGVFWAVLINTGTTDASSFGNIGQLFNPTFGHTETHH